MNMPRVVKTKIRGISNYQDNAKRVTPGEQLYIEHEPSNAYDPNAHAVFSNGRQIGYLSAELAQQLSEDDQLGAIVLDVTGGGRKKTGVNILLLIGDIDTPKEAFERVAVQELRAEGFDARLPRNPVVVPILEAIGGLGLFAAIGISKAIKRPIMAASESLGMSPALAVTIVLVTLLIGISLAVVLTP